MVTNMRTRMTTINQNKMKQKVLVLSGDDYTYQMQEQIDSALDKGWLIVSVTAQHVSTGAGHAALGGYLIVFEKPE